MAENDGGESGGNRRRTGRTVGAPQGNARSSALQELLNLKRNGGKRIDNFEVRLEEKVYDTLSEADYDRHVAKRREEAAEFVVDDEGLGYIDGADEDDWNSGKSDDDAEKGGKHKKAHGRAHFTHCHEDFILSTSWSTMRCHSSRSWKWML